MSDTTELLIAIQEAEFDWLKLKELAERKSLLVPDQIKVVDNHISYLIDTYGYHVAWENQYNELLKNYYSSIHVKLKPLLLFNLSKN